LAKLKFLDSRFRGNDGKAEMTHGDMINFLHTYTPDPILISFGQIHIYWYGFFVVLGILIGITVATKLSSYYQIKKDIIFDLAFWLIIFGLLGARIYHVFLELPFYAKQPLDIFKIWNGGLAIHGGILAGIIVLYFFIKKHQINFWQISAVAVPGLAVGQAVGRWGNYFNQELFGSPTNLSWGIPIDIINRPFAYLNYGYFHPTFLYESIGSLIIFLTLLSLHYLIIKKKKRLEPWILIIFYLVAYSLLRFCLEFIRLDSTPILAGLRFPQWVSLIIIIASALLIFIKLKPKNKNLP
jgi:phosphatidylglycerol:prolipoprotein diacylglycerol transferase